MEKRLVGILGIATAIVFAAGFIVLFIYNPLTFEELNNISLPQYNLIGMDGRLWLVCVNYIGVGLMSSILAIGLFRITMNKSIIIWGEILLLISGLIWTSFGFISYDAQTGFGNAFMLIRINIILLAAPAGLIILGAEFNKISNDRFLKHYTIATGILILLIGALSVLVFDDETWVRTNLSLAIFFFWFGVFGLRMVKRASAQQGA